MRPRCGINLGTVGNGSASHAVPGNEGGETHAYRCPKRGYVFLRVTDSDGERQMELCAGFARRDSLNEGTLEAIQGPINGPFARSSPLSRAVNPSALPFTSPISSDLPRKPAKSSVLP